MYEVVSVQLAALAIKVTKTTTVPFGVAKVRRVPLTQLTNLAAALFFGSRYSAVAHPPGESQKIQ